LLAGKSVTNYQQVIHNHPAHLPALTGLQARQPILTAWQADLMPRNVSGVPGDLQLETDIKAKDCGDKCPAARPSVAA
jgi:hypothetical protein